MPQPDRTIRDNSAARLKRNLMLLADLASTVSTLEEPRALQDEALRHAMEMFRCTSGAVCLCDADGSSVRLGRAVGNAAGFNPRSLEQDAAVHETVLISRHPLVLGAPGLRLPSAMAGWAVRAVIPVSTASSILGILVLGDPAAGENLTDEDVPLMAALGGVVAVAAETALVHAQFRQQLGRQMAEAMAELARAGAELQRLKTFNEELFNSAPVGIVLFDRELRVTFRNRAAERLWPEARTVPAGARRTDIARRDPDWEAGLRGVIHMRQPWLAEAVVLERPGLEPARLNLSTSPLLSIRGEVLGGVLIIEDVTQRVHMERRLAVSERLAGVGRLAAMVAHEINNPLDGIIRLVNLARRVAGEGGADAHLEIYLSEADKGLMRMVTIVRDLLDFSRSASGHVEPLPVAEMLAEAVRALLPAAQSAGVTVNVVCDKSVPPLRTGSLYHVVLNLVKNGIEASPCGGRVTVSARCANDALVIEVSDTGPGIPPEALTRLFEPFFSLKALGKGTGLGLVISKDLVEKLGGTVVAANRPEGGAVFAVRIPLAPGMCACEG